MHTGCIRAYAGSRRWKTRTGSNLRPIDLSGGVKRTANDDHWCKISSPNVPDWAEAVGDLGR